MLLSDCLEYYLVTVPEQLVTLIPVTLLLALLYAVTNHARYHEITAMRAAGLSLWRLSLPYLGVGLVLAGAVFAINEFWVPWSVDKADQILHRRLPRSAPAVWQNLQFSNDAEHRFWSLNFNTATAEMKNLMIISESPNGSRQELYAHRAVFTNGLWRFYNVSITQKTAEQLFGTQRTNAMMETRFSETPELMRSEIRVNKLDLKEAAKRPQLPIAEITNYLRLHHSLPSDQRAMLMTQLYGRIAEPFKCAVVVLIAIPFGARSGRRNVFVGVASSIVICFASYVAQSICMALGSGNHLPPILAAFLPNLAFGLTGIVLTLRVR